LKPRAGAPAHPADRVVLVLQGGGALGAYQWGVYEALHEAGMAPEWVIGTSIGAINGALIAGNAPEHRFARLRQFWRGVEQRVPALPFWVAAAWGPALANAATVGAGIPGFFSPNPLAWRGLHAEVGIEHASLYDTTMLRRTLHELIDFDALAVGATRLTVGAVNARSGAMRYFDSREQRLDADHVMASGALPPAFPAVTIDGEPHWDGGLYSNTPIEAVLDDNPRRDALVFAVNVWHPDGPEPTSLWQVMGRQKEVQYASRADSHIERQKQLHRLRHVIGELARELPAKQRVSARARALAAWGCCTTLHVAHLVAPRLAHDDLTKDIDFSVEGIEARRAAGHADTLRMIERAPWRDPVDPLEGVIEHR
jgi:NTE family protein